MLSTCRPFRARSSDARPLDLCGARTLCDEGVRRAIRERHVDGDAHKSCRRSATRQPSALVSPGRAGMSTVGIASSLARATVACSGPAPPKANSAKSRGSCPRARRHHADRARHAVVGDAHASRPRPLVGVEAELCANAAQRDAARIVVKRHRAHRPPAAGLRPSRPSATLASVIVGSRAAAPKADRPRCRSGAFWPHACNSPDSSTRRERAPARPDGVHVHHRAHGWASHIRVRVRTTPSGTPS